MSESGGVNGERELPAGWAWAELGDLLHRIEAGKSFTCEPRPALPDEWGVIKVSAMTWGTFDPDENKAVPAGRDINAAYQISPGDLLVSRANTKAYVGAPVLVGACRPKLLLSDKSLRLVPRDCVSKRWLVHFLRSPEARAYVEAKASGTKDAMRNLSQDALRRMPVALPPLAEQHRIVEALEEQLSRLDAAASSASQAVTRIDRLKKTLLTAKLELVGSHACLKDVLASPLINGRSVKTLEGGFPVLRLTAIKNGDIDLDEQKAGAWEVSEARPFLVAEGDFLVARGSGSLRLVGQGGVVGAVSAPVAFPDTMIRVRVDSGRVLPEYLSLVWASPVVRAQVESMARTTAGIYKVNQAILESIHFPLPPLDQQQEIVDQVKSSDEVINLARSSAGLALRRGKSLRSALLRRAFEGTLAPQVPSDEPADDVLARIKAERTMQRKRPRKATAKPPAQRVADAVAPEPTPTPALAVQQEFEL